MIHVLQVFHGMDCGGAENMIMNLYRHIDRTKVQFDFLVHTTKKCFFDDEIKSLGGRIFSIPYYNIVNGTRYKEALDALFKDHPEIKIVHGHLGSCAHVYLNVAKKHNCFTIAHSHNTKPQSLSLKNILYRLFTYKTRKIADYFFGCSMAAAEYRFGKNIAHSCKCAILKNAIDLNKFAFSAAYRKEIRAEFNIGDNFLVGHVGRFNLQKNHSFLIDIFKAVYDKNPHAVLILVGVGDLMDDIKEKVVRLNLQNAVVFTGLRSDTFKLMSAFDVFLFPSFYEGLPVTLVEAQTAGLNIVCSDAVPKESKITDRVKFVPLTETPHKWAEIVMETGVSFNRDDTCQQIRENGYDILATSEKILNFYLNVSGKNE